MAGMAGRNCLQRVAMARVRYPIVMERGSTSSGLHVPDLLGCVAIAEIKSDVCQLIREAIELYIETLEN